MLLILCSQKKITLSDGRTRWNMGSVPPRLRERGVVLNPGAGRGPRADGEMSVCVEPESLRRSVCV